MINLPSVTVCCITTKDYGESIQAIHKTLERINPARTIFFTDIPIEIKGVEVIQVQIKNWIQYNGWIIKELYQYIETTHMLIIQHDGYVLDETQWTDDFLQYDYIGAKWLYSDGRNIGNGGFSLRSKKLMSITAIDDAIQIVCPEDEVICRLYRNYLEKSHKIKFAPEEIADKFSFELNAPIESTFGFHGYHNSPFKPYICIKRTGAAGDCIMLEPVLEYYHNKGCNVVLDTDKKFHNYYLNHYFSVKWIGHHSPKIKFERIINLDMAYEISPRQLVLQSYYNICGITDGTLRNSKLNFKVDANNKLFKKYVVIHIDTTSIPHRDIHGANWKEISEWLSAEGYTVIQVGIGKHEICGIEMKTPSEQMLMWVVGGADLFIGCDSGVAQVAVALGIPSIIFFGSVNPEYRYTNFEKIKVIQNSCPIEKDGCYHSVISVKGKDCEVDKKIPPCITHKTDDVINSIREFIKDGFISFPTIMNWRISTEIKGELIKEYESTQKFMRTAPGKWIYKDGKYHHESHKSIAVSEEIILKRNDIFKLVEK
jgi:ADP-heptose:LPS heptosyltransferase